MIGISRFLFTKASAQQQSRSRVTNHDWKSRRTKEVQHSSIIRCRLNLASAQSVLYTINQQKIVYKQAKTGQRQQQTQHILALPFARVLLVSDKSKAKAKRKRLTLFLLSSLLLLNHSTIPTLLKFDLWLKISFLYRDLIETSFELLNFWRAIYFSNGIVL